MAFSQIHDMDIVADGGAVGGGVIVTVDLEHRAATHGHLDNEGYEVKRVRHVVTENARVGDIVAALGRSDWEELGRLLVAGHASMRDDFEASCPELDCAVESLLGAGAVGARMTGGGFGGSVIALVPQEREAAARTKVAAAFASRGFRPPHLFTVAPGAGARRLR